MRITLISIAVAAFLGGVPCGLYAESTHCCPSAAQTPSQDRDPEASSLEAILKRLHENATELDSCVSRIEYLFIEDPDLLDSHTLRTGHLYYLKTDDRSRVRIDFETLKQDDFEAQERLEIFLFDGVWLIKIDYTLEQVDMYQQAPEEEPLNAFDFISHHFPLIGFSGTQQVEAEFDVRLGEKNDDPNLIRLVLDVPEHSRYSSDYKKIDFWIDRELFLPRRIRAFSTLGDVFDLRFFDIETDEKPKKELFEIKTPQHFHTNIESINQEPQSKGQD